MTVMNATSNTEVFFVTLLLTGVLVLYFSTRQWWSGQTARRGTRVRFVSGYSIITIVFGLVVLGLTSGPVPAKEMFSIPVDGSFEFYRVDSEIQNPDLSLAGASSSAWPGLASTRDEGKFQFMDTKVKDSSLIIDPGFRMSLTNRIITVGGRIAWPASFQEFDLFLPLHEQGSLNLEKLNRERLTGVYELARMSESEPQGLGYN